MKTLVGGWPPVLWGGVATQKFDPGAIRAFAVRLAEHFVYLAEIAELMWLVRESITAVTFVNGLHQQPPGGPEGERKARIYGELAAVAERVRSADFALLHANSLVGVWGATEAVIEDLAVIWVSAQEDAHSLPAFAKMKLPVGDMLGRDRLGQAKALIGELQRQERSEARLGAGQFEAVLDAIGLGGAVDEDMRRDLLAAQQTRHLVAHRNGVADERFVSRCPWLGIKAGETADVSSTAFAAYVRACGGYVQTVSDRAIDRASRADAWVGEAFEAARLDSVTRVSGDEVRERLRAAKSLGRRG